MRFKMKYAPRSRIMYLETIANKESENPDAQAEYLKVTIIYMVILIFYSFNSSYYVQLRHSLCLLLSH